MVYPRTIIQKALEHNAAAVIASHNHPSGSVEPSLTDKKITKGLKAILKVLDIRMIDHIIISHQEAYSFAEHGLL